MELDLSQCPITGARIANEILARPGVFDPRAGHRVIEGICTSAKQNKNGRLFHPETANFELPMPLLWIHDWLTPLGVVVSIKSTSAGLWFRARIVDGRLTWADQAWAHLKASRILAVSVTGRGDTDKWNLFEISLCEEGACADARIVYVKEVHQPGVVWFDDSKRETIYRDVRPKTWPAHFSTSRPGATHLGQM